MQSAGNSVHLQQHEIKAFGEQNEQQDIREYYDLPKDCLITAHFGLSNVQAPGKDLRGLYCVPSGYEVKINNFEGANLEGAGFGSHELYHNNFTGANLRNADFSEAVIMANNQFAQADATGADFSNSTIGDFMYTYDMEFEQTNLEHANFSGSHFHQAHFKDANLTRANFTGTEWKRHSKLDTAKLDGAIFLDVDLRHIQFSDEFDASSLITTTEQLTDTLNGEHHAVYAKHIEDMLAGKVLTARDIPSQEDRAVLKASLNAYRATHPKTQISEATTASAELNVQAIY